MGRSPRPFRQAVTFFFLFNLDVVFAPFLFLSPPAHYPQTYSPCNVLSSFFLFSFLFSLMNSALLHLTSKKVIHFCAVQWRPYLGNTAHAACVLLEPGTKKQINREVLPTRLYSFIRVQSRPFAVASYHEWFVRLPIFLFPLKTFSLDLIGILIHRKGSVNDASTKKQVEIDSKQSPLLKKRNQLEWNGLVSVVGARECPQDSGVSVAQDSRGIYYCDGFSIPGTTKAPQKI